MYLKMSVYWRYSDGRYSYGRYISRHGSVSTRYYTRQIKPGFHYPSSRAELTARELGCIFWHPSLRPELTGHNNASKKDHGPTIRHRLLSITEPASQSLLLVDKSFTAAIFIAAAGHQYFYRTIHRSKSKLQTLECSLAVSVQWFNAVQYSCTVHFPVASPTNHGELGSCSHPLFAKLCICLSRLTIA